MTTDAEGILPNLAPLRGKRILVTGASGFIGNLLVRRLNESDIEATTVASGRAGSLFKGEATATCDVSDAAAVETLVRRADPQIVFHLAGLRGSSRSYEFADEAVRVNTLGTLNLLSALGRCATALERVILLGTSEEYGNTPILPVVEDLPVDPVSPYSASKAAATQFAMLYNTLFDLPVVVFRPFIVYGPGQTPTMLIPELIQTLLDGRDFPMTGGEQTRDVVYVDDVVDCLMLGAISEPAVGEIFNICSGLEHRIIDIAERIVRLSGSSLKLRAGAIPYRDNEVWRLFGSNRKAGELLGWSPSTSLEVGLSKTIEWFRQQMTGSAMSGSQRT